MFCLQKYAFIVVGRWDLNPATSGDVTHISLLFSGVVLALSTYDTAAHLMI